MDVGTNKLRKTAIIAKHCIFLVAPLSFASVLRQVLLPGREEGHNLRSTSMAIRPGTDDLYIVTNDGTGGQGATIFRARAFAKALPLYSHQ